MHCNNIIEVSREERMVVARTGRPKSDNPRVRNVTIRLTSREYEDVSGFAADRGQTVTKTLLDGFYEMKERNRKKDN